jgi:hypothetical protein
MDDSEHRGDDGAPAAAAPRRRKGNAQLRALARDHVEAAVAALVAVMSDPNASPAARVSAAGALLSWGYGKWAQAAASGDKGRAPPERVVRLAWGDGTF